MLGNMKQLAVEFQNPAVNVQEFLGMYQQVDEGVRHYISGTRGVASRCQFEVTCTCGGSVSYGDQVIRFKLISGLQDTDIKEDILSIEDKSLEETVKMIENKGSGRQAKKTVGEQNPAQIIKIQPEPGPLQCSHCGRKTHGSSQPERQKNCRRVSRNPLSHSSSAQSDQAGQQDQGPPHHVRAVAVGEEISTRTPDLCPVCHRVHQGIQ